MAPMRELPARLLFPRYCAHSHALMRAHHAHAARVVIDSGLRELDAHERAQRPDGPAGASPPRTLNRSHEQAPTVGYTVRPDLAFARWTTDTSVCSERLRGSDELGK